MRRRELTFSTGMFLPAYVTDLYRRAAVFIHTRRYSSIIAVPAVCPMLCLAYSGIARWFRSGKLLYIEPG